MPVQIRCVACRKKLNVRDQFIGKKIKCPLCRHAFVVDALSPAAHRNQWNSAFFDDSQGPKKNREPFDNERIVVSRGKPRNWRPTDSNRWTVSNGPCTTVRVCTGKAY